MTFHKIFTKCLLESWGEILWLLLFHHRCASGYSCYMHFLWNYFEYLQDVRCLLLCTTLQVSKLVLFFSFCIARNSDKYDRFISSWILVLIKIKCPHCALFTNWLIKHWKFKKLHQGHCLIFNIGDQNLQMKEMIM